MKDCLPDSFKRGVLEYISGATPMIALYTRQAGLDDNTPRYTPDNEVRGDGYRRGGERLEGTSIEATEGGFALVAYNPSWANATITARGALIYLAGDTNRAVRVIDFGRDVSSTNDMFRITFPTAADGGIISI